MSSSTIIGREYEIGKLIICVRFRCVRGLWPEGRDHWFLNKHFLLFNASVRVISVKLDSSEYEYLVTNIFDKSFTVQMFRHLYFLRWPCETKYLELKERLQIEDFNGATTT